MAPIHNAGLGGQSAPPSLKPSPDNEDPASLAGLGGQSAPPSLKQMDAATEYRELVSSRGAVRPPFIEADMTASASALTRDVSGGSPPPLH